MTFIVQVEEELIYNIDNLCMIGERKLLHYLFNLLCIIKDYDDMQNEDADEITKWGGKDRWWLNASVVVRLIV